jgi:hypothetical protein
MSDITPARKLFDLLVSRDFDPEMLDSAGRPAADPAETEIFSFDFRAHSGKDYGTVVIMLGDDNGLEVYCADNVGRSMEGPDKNDWFAFLEQLKNFAVRNFMTFGIKNLNRLRYSMQGQAAIREGLFESWTGNRTTSWNGAPTEARLMIRHKKAISEGDARYRYIESLFIETADSERYRLPFTSLTAGRAMLEHVRQGGRPYDARGNHISEMVTELAVLSRFRRANAGHVFEGDTQQLLEQVQQYQSNLQRSLKSLATRTGYTTYFESWSPADISEQDMVIESLKNLFVKQSIDTRIESALPLLAKIQQQGNEMKEANIFEAWANRLVEGTWQLPDTPEKQDQLVELLSTDLPVGADATNATEQLYDLVGDDELFDQLSELAERDANANARQVVIDRLQQLSDDPDVRRVLDQLQIDPTAEMNPPEAVNPADLEPDQPGVAEGYQLDEGAVETITALVKKIPGIGKYYQLAQQYKPQLIQILKTSKSGKEVKQKMEELVAQQPAPVAESGLLKQLGGLAVGGGSILSTMWMNAMGMIDGVLAHAAAGSVGGAVASGSILGLIPVTLMLFAAMLLFKGSKQSSDEKAQQFQAQRGQQGVAEGDDQLDEIGDTPKGQAALRAVDARGTTAMDTWNKNPASGYTKAPKQITRQFKGAMDADRRLHGFGLDASAKGRAQRQIDHAKKYSVAENVLLDSTGSTFQHILDTFKRDVRDFKETGEVSDELHDALYDYYFDDMPYGTQKARTGDPHAWVADRFGSDLGMEGYGSHSPGVPDEDYGIERESAGDYADEYQDPLASMLKIAGVPAAESPAPEYDHSDMDEGIVGAALGGIGGALVGGPVGALRGASIGDKIGDAIGGTNETTDEAIDPANPRDYERPAIQRKQAGQAPLTVQDIEQKDRKAQFDFYQRAHGRPHPDSVAKDDQSPLAGQYGHAGRMKEVGKDVSFLDRLKELSGMKK